VVTDCEPGLACVQQADGSRRCSSDLTPIQMPAEAGGGMVDAAPQDGAADGDAPAPPMGDSAAPQDTGSPPPPDTGSPPQDTGAPPPPDTGSPPPQDSGMAGDTASE
jgi:hypothetical protein